MHQAREYGHETTTTAQATASVERKAAEGCAKRAECIASALGFHVLVYEARLMSIEVQEEIQEAGIKLTEQQKMVVLDEVASQLQVCNVGFICLRAQVSWV